jgi:hypothetical protein
MLVKAITPSYLKLTLAAGVTAIALTLFAGRIMVSAGGDVPLFKTPMWQQRGSLLLRREAADGGALLLKHSAREVVYKYNPAERSLAQSTPNDWADAKGEVADCDKQFHPSPFVLDIDPKTHRLSAGGRDVQTAGRAVLDMRVSPGKSRVAVVSAEGRSDGSIFPTLGGGAGAGQHYHQVFSLPDVKQVGESVRLRLGGKDELITPCWSAEERFVVYTDTLFFSLTVVDINVTL